MKGSIEKTLLTGITIALASVLAIVLVSLWQSRRLRDTASIIRHTNVVIYETKEILDITTRYELDVKNFLLTGNPVFLDSLNALSIRQHDTLAQLKRQVSDNPPQEDRVVRLSLYVDSNIELLKDAMALSRGNNIGKAAELIAGSATTGHSYRVRSLCNQVESEENRLLNIRRQANQRVSMQLTVVLWVLTVAVLVLGFVIVKKIRLDLDKVRGASEELARFNSALEQRVRQQTAELQASESKYRSLFYQSPLPKWIYDLETLRFLEVNDMATRMYGFSEDEFKNMTIRDIRPAEDNQALTEDIETINSDSHDQRRKVWRHLTRNGTAIDVEITAHPFEYEGRKARMVVVSDISGRLRTEQLLQHMNEDLQRRASELSASNAELERFAYIASHDLQEPLRMVSSFLQLLQKRYKGKLDEKADQYIHYAVDGAERMKALIQDLLEYSRLGTANKNFSAVEMEDVMEEVGNIFREKIEEAGARLHWEPLPQVHGDRVQLVQLMQNLVGNALKYRSELPAEVTIRSIKIDGFHHFSVQDNGIGIEPQFFDKIFIIFQRLHNRSEYSGTGIGLAVCKKIVERHGGRIWVEAAPVRGSVFNFTLKNK